jgi:hypothetical protein
VIGGTDPSTRLTGWLCAAMPVELCDMDSDALMEMAVDAEQGGATRRERCRCNPGAKDAYGANTASGTGRLGIPSARGGGPERMRAELQHLPARSVRNGALLQLPAKPRS